MALAESFSQRDSAEVQNIEWDAALKQTVRGKGYSADPRLLQMFGTGDAEAEIEKMAGTSRLAALYDTAFKFEDGKEPNPKALEFLAGSKMKEGRAAAQIYRSDKLSPQQARNLVSNLPETSFLYRLVRAHALKKAGDDSLYREVSKGPSFWVMGAVGLLGCGALLIGGFLWMVYLAFRNSGQLKPAGLPMGELSPARADLLAMKGNQLLASYLVLSIVVSALLQNAPMSARAFVSVAAMFLLVVALFRLPVSGWLIRLRDLGVNGRNFGKNVLWGFAGYLATIPLLVVTAVIATQLAKFLPKPYHPIGNVIMNTNDPWLLFAIFLQAAVLAPFWEEILFRGCLYPAMSRVTGRLIVGALLSSFMFVSIHPQGIAGWLPLITIALVSCQLAYQTRSLVPSIVLHALNNGVALGVSLLLMR
ncbi:MAG TPA: type II CAAX endopeptidase family protein [Fimbriimonas sp.]